MPTPPATCNAPDVVDEISSIIESTVDLINSVSVDSVFVIDAELDWKFAPNAFRLAPSTTSWLVTFKLLSAFTLFVSAEFPVTVKLAI